MAIILAGGDQVSPANPALDFYAAAAVSAAGTDWTWFTSVPPFSLEYTILRRPTDGPAVVVVPRTELDLVTGAVPGSIARYAPTWDVPLETGRHEIRWFVKQAPSSPERVERRFFDVMDEAPARSVYALVSDMRAEGILETDASDARLITALEIASEMVEMYTGRFFEPRAMDITLDGSGGWGIQFGAPVILLTQVHVGLDWPPYQVVEPENFRVYNRHISQRLTDPDDREDPRVEFLHGKEIFGLYYRPRYYIPSWYGGMFYEGTQNIRIRGVFGYTDPDGSAVGATPRLIAHATKMITVREMGGLGNTCDRDMWRDRWRVTSEKTRDQSWTRQALSAASEGAFTGDRAIDDLILRYRAPMGMGAV